MLAEQQPIFEIKWRLLALLAIFLPLTLATKFIPTGNTPYDKLAFESKMRSFLKSKDVQVSSEVFANELFIPIRFTSKSCNNYVIVLPLSEQWTTAITNWIPKGYVAKFSYKEYLSDEYPAYRSIVNDLYNVLAYPTSQVNRRQFILALIATPTCMKTIQEIDWNQFRPS